MLSDKLGVTGELWHIRARRTARTLLGLLGVCCVLLGAVNLLTGTTVLPEYRVFGAVVTRTAGYYIGDMVLIAGGAVVVWVTQ